MSESVEANGALDGARPWQREAVAALKQVIDLPDNSTPEGAETWQKCLSGTAPMSESTRHLVVSAPTGVGKTMAAKIMCEAVIPENGVAVMTVGLSALRDQHYRAIKAAFSANQGAAEVMFKGLQAIRFNGNRTLIIDTWQSLAAKAKADFTFDSDLFLMIFDEAHFGGSDAAVQSIPAVLKKFRPEYLVSMSATIQTISESVVGPKRGIHAYKYSVADAYKEGLLHDVDLIEVITGTTITLEDRTVLEQLEQQGTVRDGLVDHEVRALMDRLAKQSGSKRSTLKDVEKKIRAMVEERLDRDIAITTRARELFGDQITGATMEEIVKTLEKLDTGTERLREVARSRYAAAIGIYLNHHAGKKAIVFCPSIDLAEDAHQVFQTSKGLVPENRSLRSAYLHSKMTDAERVTNAFRGFMTDEDGNEIPVPAEDQYDVIFVVGMLQEGFDMPPLSLAFDCRFSASWNKSRAVRFTQRVGRLTRPCPGKVAPAKYYYFRDVTHYHQSVDIGDMGSVNSFLAQEKEPDDVKERKQAAALSGQILATMSGADDEDEVPFDAEGVTAEHGTIETLSRNSVSPDPTGTPVGSNEDDIDIQSIATAANYRTVTTNLFGIVSGYEMPTKNISYRSLFASAPNEAKKTKAGLLARAAKPGSQKPSPVSQDPEERRLGCLHKSYICERSSSFDAEYRDHLYLLAPQWIPQQFLNIEERFEEVMVIANSGAPPPNRKSKDKRERGLALFIGRLSPEHSKILKSVRKDWFQETRRSKMMYDILQRAERGLPRPSRHSTSPVERRMANFIKSQMERAMRDTPVGEVARSFIVELKTKAPQWFADHHTDPIARSKELHATGISKAAIAKQLASEGFLSRTGKPYSAVSIQRFIAKPEPSETPPPSLPPEPIVISTNVISLEHNDRRQATCPTEVLYRARSIAQQQAGRG